MTDEPGEVPDARGPDAEGPDVEEPDAEEPDLPWFVLPLGRRPRRYLDLSLIGWLALIWMLLWNELSWANAAVGVVVSLVICLVFPLPATDIALRVRPLGVVRLLIALLYDMFVSGLQVTRQVFVPRHPPAAVIAVQLRCRTDLMLTATAVAVTHVPDSSVVEVRRSTATLFLHVLDADNPAALAASRLATWRLEALVVRAFGTREEIARVAVEPAEEDAL